MYLSMMFELYCVDKPAYRKDTRSLTNQYTANGAMSTLSLLNYFYIKGNHCHSQASRVVDMGIHHGNTCQKHYPNSNGNRISRISFVSGLKTDSSYSFPETFNLFTIGCSFLKGVNFVIKSYLNSQNNFT